MLLEHSDAAKIQVALVVVGVRSGVRSWILVKGRKEVGKKKASRRDKRQIVDGSWKRGEHELVLLIWSTQMSEGVGEREDE